MKQYLTYILVAMAFLLVNVSPVVANEINVYDGSAELLASERGDTGLDLRAIKLADFFAKRNSPLTPYASDFIYWADKYNLDWRMVPAITGVESTFGKRIPVNSYNAYGWANGEYQFSSWPNSIEHVNRVLKEKYVDKGTVTINQIAKVYAPPSDTWGGKVKYFINKIDAIPVSFDI